MARLGGAGDYAAMSSIRRQIAFFSPLPPERSGIADYSAELLPYLARWVDVTLFAARPACVADSLRDCFPIRDIAEYGAMRWRFDVALHQMGASMYHDAMYDVLLRYGGIVTLHEHNLHQFIATRTIVMQRNFAGYEREMGYALGIEGVRTSIEIGQGQREHPLARYCWSNACWIAARGSSSTADSGNVRSKACGLACGRR